MARKARISGGDAPGEKLGSGFDDPVGVALDMLNCDEVLVAMADGHGGGEWQEAMLEWILELKSPP